MQSKEKLREQLRELNVVPPSDATAAELLTLLNRVKALKAQDIARPPQPVPRPRFTPQPVTTSPGAALSQTRLPLSDHRRRPHDPMAGW